MIALEDMSVEYDQIVSWKWNVQLGFTFLHDQENFEWAPFN